MASLCGTPVERVVVVPTSSIQVLAANARRLRAILQNLGANPITLRLDGSAAVVGQGFVLSPQSASGQGDSASMLDMTPCHMGAISAVAQGKASSLYVAEFS